MPDNDLPMPSRTSDRAGFLTGPLARFALVAVLGTVVVVWGSLVASRHAGEGEAIQDVRVLTSVLARTVVEPNLTEELLAGDPEAFERLDWIVRGRVIDESTLRVKLWDADGRIVYSDEPRLVGEVYALDDDKLEAFELGAPVSEVTSLDGPENRFDDFEGGLLEVYLPILGPDGQPLLWEAYYALDSVDESAGRIFGAFVPVVLGALAVMEAFNLGLAWLVTKRLQAAQADRERLLRRAIDASDTERRRIAGDLHDGVVQELVGTSFAVSAAAASVGEIDPVAAADLRTASVGVRRSLQSLRALLVDIYPPNLRTQGLEASVIDLLAPADGLGIETELAVTGPVDADLDRAALAHRVVQESVRNVFRHAEATTLSVTIEATADRLVAEVVDDGKGFRPDRDRPEGHFGLRIVDDLVHDAGATWRIESDPGRGTRVRLEVPA